jgi:outer membrane protein insertion porin family
MIHAVAFIDHGTVTPDVSLDDYRVAPGVGLRITVPAMGPAPIALDFAWPVAGPDTDDERVFTFNVGFQR